MNEGVKILLERMKTNPEEFAIGDGGFHTLSKWGRLIADYQTYLEPEDCEILKSAINKLHQQTFTEKVMKELLAPEDDSLGKPWYTKQGNITLSGGQTLASSLTTSKPWVVGTTLTANSNSLTLGTATLTDTKLHELLHMKAQLESERQKQKKHKTLFGKLFNYT